MLIPGSNWVILTDHKSPLRSSAVFTRIIPSCLYHLSQGILPCYDLHRLCIFLDLSVQIAWMPILPIAMQLMPHALPLPLWSSKYKYLLFVTLPTCPPTPFLVTLAISEFDQAKRTHLVFAINRRDLQTDPRNRPQYRGLNHLFHYCTPSVKISLVTKCESDAPLVVLRSSQYWTTLIYRENENDIRVTTVATPHPVWKQNWTVKNRTKKSVLVLYYIIKTPMEGLRHIILNLHTSFKFVQKWPLSE